jgi:hypothetical protein
MKVYKVELMVLDFDGIGAEGIKDEIENTKYGNRCISPEVKGCEERDIGEWSDDHPLNHRDKSDAEYRRLFMPNSPTRPAPDSAAQGGEQ